MARDALQSASDRAPMPTQFVAISLAMALSYAACGADKGRANASAAARPTSTEQANTMKLRLKTGDKVITATLMDNATSRDFVSLLPMSMTLEDYAATEKISNLPRKLSTEGAPAGSTPSIGDIAYYAPWGNIALFYRDFGYSSGLIKLGKIDSAVEVLNTPGSIAMTIELAD
jgi:hypothetical protein